MSTFTEHLKTEMNKYHYRQVDMIRLVNEAGAPEGIHIGKSHMSQYCSGKTVPRDDILRVLAKVLKVDPVWLKGADHEKPADNPPKVLSAEENAAAQAVADAPKSVPGEASAANSPTGDFFDEGERKYPKVEFKKSTKLNDVLYDVRGPVVDTANLMSNAGIDILKLNIGNPAPFGFHAPDEVLQDFCRQAVECEGYSDSKGLFSTRKAIMQYSQLKNIPDVQMQDIYTGNGASELISLSMQALLNDGDEILIPSPDYPLWTASATLAGGKPVHYICDEQAEWNPDLADMEKKITSRTKAIVIINPNNPTGALYPREILERIAELARRHNLIVFSDEIYDRLVMDGGEHISIASIAPDLFCVTFSGLSKSHMIAGYRIGWMILSGNKQAARDYIEGLNMLSNMRLCSNVPAQSIVQTALGGYQSVENYIVPGGRVYEQRNFVYDALCDIPGISAVKPKAGFYVFPKLDIKKFHIHNDEQFALDFLREKHVLIVQGTGFNWKKPDHFRIVFLPRIELLGEAMEKLRDFLSTYHQ